jgi:hypothetical protein
MKEEFREIYETKMTVKKSDRVQGLAELCANIFQESAPIILKEFVITFFNRTQQVE